MAAPQEQRQAGRQQRDGNGSRSREHLGLDEEGLADPEQAEQEIAEAEPPADRARAQREARQPVPPSATAPSMSQTSTGSVINSTGQAKNGAMRQHRQGAGREAATRLRQPPRPARAPPAS